MDYKSENVWLMQGDCLERMQDIPDGSIDAIITDPPYGTTACKWDAVIPLDAMRDAMRLGGDKVVEAVRKWVSA